MHRAGILSTNKIFTKFGHLVSHKRSLKKFQGSILQTPHSDHNKITFEIDN